MVSETAVGFILEGATARCRGNWTAANLHDIEQRLSTADWPATDIRLDLGAIENLDTVGAWLLHRTISALESGGAEQGREVQVDGADVRTRQLLALVGGKSAGADHPPKPYLPGVLENAGRHAGSQTEQYLEFLVFIGNLAWVSVLAILRPWRIRWPQVVGRQRTASCGGKRLAHCWPADLPHWHRDRISGWHGIT